MHTTIVNCVGLLKASSSRQELLGRILRIGLRVRDMKHHPSHSEHLSSSSRERLSALDGLFAEARPPTSTVDRQEWLRDGG